MLLHLLVKHLLGHIQLVRKKSNSHAFLNFSNLQFTYTRRFSTVPISLSLLNGVFTVFLPNLNIEKTNCGNSWFLTLCIIAKKEENASVFFCGYENYKKNRFFQLISDG